MTETTPPGPDYQWAIHADPDLLVIQFPPVVAVANGEPLDAMTALFTRRGFRPLSEAADLALQPANGCALTSSDPASAELVVLVGEDGTASRIPIPHADPAWGARVFEAGQVAVLVTIAAIGEDGTVTQERLRRDVEAGGVLAALVPAGDLR